MMTGTVCFKLRNKYCNAEIGNLGANRGTGKNLLSKMPYFESPTPICLSIMQLLSVYDND